MPVKQGGSEAAVIADVIREDSRWPELDTLVGKCFDIVTTIDVDDFKGGVVALVLTSDRHIQELNRDFRNKDKATNVLSFPAETVPGLPEEAAENHLGDIILAYETCVSEANNKAISLQDHAAHLILHGWLHLLGYDHQNDSDASKMEGLETALLAKLGVKDPYATDGSPEERKI